MKTVSPFYIKQEFLSPMMCEEIVDNLEFTIPDVDKDENPLHTFRYHELNQDAIFERMTPIIDEMERRFGFEYKGMTQMQFEWFPQGCIGEEVHCENSEYLRKKWLKTKERDFTVVIFLSDYRDKTPFDGDFEVYGGKLEFPQHGFGLNPERGTMVIFPSGPHFINATNEIIAGDSFIAKFHIAAKHPYLYDPAIFPGDYISWLQEFA